MNALALINEEFIFTSENTLKTNSLKVADAFGKLHKNILQKIEAIECSDDFRRLNFKLSSIEQKIPNGAAKQIPCYEMTKDGLVFLVMGFTGVKAAAIKEAYINAFNILYERLHSPQPAQPASTNNVQFDLSNFMHIVKLKGYVLVPRETIQQFQELRKSLNSAEIYYIE